MLGGIGFTMSIFITLLAFKNDGEEIITYSKIAILIASFLSGTFGFIYLKLTFKAPKKRLKPNLIELLNSMLTNQTASSCNFRNACTIDGDILSFITMETLPNSNYIVDIVYNETKFSAKMIVL